MMFADPLLEQAGMPATMFVITGPRAEPGIYYADWDKLEGYARSGRWDIQSHTDDSHREHKVAGGDVAARADQPGARASRSTSTAAAVRADLERDQRAPSRTTSAGARSPSPTPSAPTAPTARNDPGIRDVLREEVARRYALAFHQDDQDTVPLLTGGEDLLRLRRVEVENWTGLQLLRRIEQARLSVPGAPPGTGPAPVVGGAEPAVPGAPPSAVVTAPAPAAAAAPAPTTPAVAAVTTPPAASGGGPAVVATVPPSPVTTVPPATVPPGTSPPTTLPPTTSPPTTRPPTTLPPTTTCKPAGNSGKCAPGQS